MTIELKKEGEVVTIDIAGRLDTTTAPVLDKTINDNFEGTKDLVLNLKGLSYISSAGLRVLLNAQKKMQKVGTLTLKNVCDDVYEVFEMTGFSEILTIEKRGKK